LLFSLFSLLFFLAFEQPFKAGLGPVVDTRPPTVTLKEPGAGSYIWSTRKFTGTAEDDYKLKKVEVKVTSHTGLRDSRAQDEYAEYREVELNLSKQNIGKWSWEFPTMKYNDGDIKMKIKVTDSWNKTAETEEISFYLNNDAPLIMVTAPPIVSDPNIVHDPEREPGSNYGEAGSDKLNYDAERDGIHYGSAYGREEFPRSMDTGTSLSGSISYAQDIYTGAETEGKYPPQIRLWRVDDGSGAGGYKPGEPPTTEQVPWHTLDTNPDNLELFAVGQGKYQFKFTIPDDIGYYGFELRAHNQDGRAEFHYPRGFYPQDDGNILNSYVLIYLRPQREAVEVGIYALEDITAYWNNGGGRYPALQVNGKDLDDNQAHPYVNSMATVNKNGPFTLRIKALHSDDVDSAEVYWAREGRTERGRFIWDPAAGTPDGVSPDKWNVAVQSKLASSPYTGWAYRDKDTDNTGRIVRSFFFTYHHNGQDRIPADAGYNSLVRGKSKIQRYTGNGSSEIWNELKRSRALPDNTDWEDVSVLEDGVYNLEVYVYSRTGSAPTLLNCSVRVDTTKPLVEVTRVEGAYAEPAASGGNYIVNGVIQPRLLITEDGSGPRTANTAGNYFNNLPEQLFILVDNAQRAALENSINSAANWWPVNQDGIALDSGIAANSRRDGPVVNTMFKLKTSGIYPSKGSAETDTLDDSLPGQPYSLYVFCRDNAFNVGHTEIRLDVQKETDKPTVDFGVGAIKPVTDPNTSADGTDAGFSYNGEVRNKLAAGKSIRLYIRDDDSLDLGTASDDSGVTVSIQGSSQDTSGHISASGPVYEVDSAQIKTVFEPQNESGENRDAVKVRLGDITQEMLCKAMAPSGGYTGTSLPDGMYRISIGIKDFPPLKMRMADSDNDPEVAENSVFFWIAVDTEPPQPALDSSSVQPEEYIQNGAIIGKVSDKNGPVKVTPTVNEGAPNERDKIIFNAELERTADTSLWEYNFNASINMHDASGRFRFDLTFEDRFENRNTLSMWLQVDKAPPTALVGSKIPTFARPYSDVTDTGGSVITAPDNTRLANGVLRFTINANDTSGQTAERIDIPGKLAEVKWWLVPGGPNWDGSNYETYTGDGSGNSRNGTLTSNFAAARYIDSALLPDGAYTLYVMAKDNAGNKSALVGGSKQTIYLLKKQDKPYFGNPDAADAADRIRPANGAVVNDPTIRGRIYDDDGFFVGSDNQILDGSVTIWMSGSPLPSYFDVTDESAYAAAGFGTPKVFGTDFTGGLTREARNANGESIISMVIDLKALFGTDSGSPLSNDGAKHYIIEAQDSYGSKYKPDGTADTVTRASRRKLFSFEYDTKPPKITLSPPSDSAAGTNPDKYYPRNDQGVKTFGPNAADDGAMNDNFHLMGAITDVNLKKNANNNYYFEYQLDSAGAKKQFELLPAYILTNTVNPTTNERTVEFNVPASVFCDHLEFTNDNIVKPGTTYAMTFFAYDEKETNNWDTYTFNFKKDQDSPKLAFTKPGKEVQLPKVNYPAAGGVPRDWWWFDTTVLTTSDLQQAWFLEKHNELDKIDADLEGLPLISYDRNNANSKPELKVLFSDLTSDVDSTSLKYWIDNDNSPRTAAAAGAAGKIVPFTIFLTSDGTEGGTALSDGVHSIRFKIQDSVGNVLQPFDDSGNIYYGFRINSGPPQIELKNIKNSSGTVITSDVFGAITTADANTFFGVEFTATGPNLKETELIIRHTDGATSCEKKPLAGGVWSFVEADNAETLDWTNCAITLADLKAAGGISNNTLKPGKYELELRAKGRDGVLSDPVIKSFTIDTISPTLKLNDFKEVNNVSVNPDYWANNPAVIKNVFTSGNQSIQVQITDQNSNLDSAQISLQRYNYGTGSWGDYYTKTGDDTGTWGTAAWGNELLIMSPNKEKTTDKRVNWTLNSIQDISDGLYRVQLRARDSAYVNGTSGWTGTDDGNSVTTTGYYYFFYASLNPVITFTNEDKLYSASAAAASATATTAAISFGITASNANGYQSLKVEVKNSSAPSYSWDTTVNNSTGTVSGSSWNADWTPTVNVTLPTAKYSPAGTSKDGTYTLTFTVTDWAGKTASRSRTITLDNTPPKAAFTKPDPLPDSIRGEQESGIYYYGSETIYGGVKADITGTAEDTNGLAGIWYHLGYFDTNPTAFPTNTQAIQSVVSGAVTDSGDNNTAFDNAAKASTVPGSKSGWFKYEYKYTEADGVTLTSYPQPDIETTPVFSPITGTVTPYNWNLSVPVGPASPYYDISSFAKDNITVKGTYFNGTGNIKMVRSIVETGLPDTYKKNGGLYSLPLIIRVADNAGNVEYFKRDIWLYPNGDYPSNVITNPTDIVGAQNLPRGGTVPFDGMANDNVNIQSVIYRIRADNAADSTTAPTGAAANQIIHPAAGPGVTRFTQATHPGPWAVFIGSQNPNPADTEGWYIATLEGGTKQQSKPWNFNVNANNEFTTKTGDDSLSPIERWGFKTVDTLPANDIIRVYVEVLVFDGGGTSGTTWNKMSLGTDNTGTSAKADTRIFYLMNTSPAINEPQLSKVNQLAGESPPTPAGVAYETYANGRTRSGRFAVKMKLDSGSINKNISEVQVQLPSESDTSLTGWRTAWSSGGGIGSVSGVSFSTTTAPDKPATIAPGQTAFYMTYAFDTAITSLTNGLAPVMQGSWANGGGEYVINVRLHDNSSPSAQVEYKFTIGVDNFAPVEDREVITNPKVAGTNVTFLGRAYDYYNNNGEQPGVYGIDKIYAWFTQDSSGTSNYVSLDGTTGTLTTTTTTAWKGRSATFGYDNDDEERVISITNVFNGDDTGYVSRTHPDPDSDHDPVTGKSRWIKVISEETQDSSTFLQPITAGRSVHWSFTQDTTKLTPGRIYLNYIVIDKAGNASLFQQKMVVMNNYPVITGVSLYTDNTGKGAVFTSDATWTGTVPSSMPKGYFDTGFISKNKYIGFKVTAEKGNNNLSYHVQYVTREEITLDTATLKQMAVDSTTKPANTSDIFTISHMGNMSNPIWATLMGKPESAVNAKQGMTFAFKATLKDIETEDGALTSNARVWRYSLVGSPSIQTQKLNLPLEVPADDNPNKDFRFEGDSHFGAGKIPEKLGNDLAFFLIKVWDEVDSTFGEDDQLYDALVVGMNVYITDGNAPTARLYDLNPYTETAVVGNNITDDNKIDTAKNAANPTAVGSNIVRGGLYNTNTAREMVKSGYIDPRDQSKALAPRVQNSDGEWINPTYPLKVEGDSVSTTDSNDKVSGKIILRGLARDDQLIDEIQIQIGNDPQKTILTLQDFKEDGITPITQGYEGEIVTKIAPVYIPNNDPDLVVDYRNKAFAVETLHWKTGHTVEWSYIWDTETEPTTDRNNMGPMTDVPIVVEVKDKNSGKTSDSKTSTSDAPENGTYHNKVNVDIVPYITGFERETSTTKRSLQGWYSFYRGENGIKVKGYNFGNADSTVTVLLNGTSLGTTSVATGDNPQQKRVFNISDATTWDSGQITLTVGDSTEAHNNSITVADIATRSWNKEYNEFTPGSTLWVNIPYAHIWQTKQVIGNSTTTAGTVFGANGDSAGLDSPGMALQYNGSEAGKLHAVWSAPNTDEVFYARNDGYNEYSNNNTGNITSTRQRLKLTGEPYTATDIDYYNAGDNEHKNNASAVMSYQRDGGPRLVLKPTMVESVATNNGGGDDAGYIIARGINPSSTNRWQNARIIKAAVSTAEGAPGHVYITAYDAYQSYKRLFFTAEGDRVMTAGGYNVSGQPDGQGNPNDRERFLDGNNSGVGVVNSNTWGSVGTTNTDGTTSSTSSSAGQWSAVDYDSSTKPVVVYYDETNNTLRLAYFTGTVTATDLTNLGTMTNWIRRYVLPTGHKLRAGSGTYVSMKIDRANKITAQNVEGGYGTTDEDTIHLAFYNSTYRTVVYAVGSLTGNFKAYAIDRVVEGGQWTDISVDKDGNPWIVYADASRLGNRDGVRIAYKGTFTRSLKDTITGEDIKGWEAMTMPSESKVNNDRLNIAVWPPTGIASSDLTTASPIGGWHAAVGYGSDQFRIGYFFKPTVPSGF
jgi:hypothetical protein